MQDTLTIEVPRPNSVDELQTVRREASDRAYVEAVLDLVRRGIVSAGYGAGLLKIDAATLLELLRRHGISVADYPADALRREVEEALHDFATDADHQD